MLSGSDRVITTVEFLAFLRLNNIPRRAHTLLSPLSTHPSMDAWAVSVPRPLCVVLSRTGRCRHLTKVLILPPLHHIPSSRPGCSKNPVESVHSESASLMFRLSDFASTDPTCCLAVEPRLSLYLEPSPSSLPYCRLHCRGTS